MSTAEKIRAAEAAAHWRRRHPGPVVFTNGVFDLLHVGHVALLEAARAEGAALIVGVNSDASVRRLGKASGGDRPVVPERERTRLVAALAAVDCVVLFDEDSPLVLIERLRPDVLVLRFRPHDQPSHVQAEIHSQTANHRNKTIQPLRFHQTSHSDQSVQGVSVRFLHGGAMAPARGATTFFLPVDEM